MPAKSTDYPEEGGSMLLRNVGTYIPIHTASQLRRPESSIREDLSYNSHIILIGQ